MNQDWTRVAYTALFTAASIASFVLGHPSTGVSFAAAAVGFLPGMRQPPGGVTAWIAWLPVAFAGLAAGLCLMLKISGAPSWAPRLTSSAILAERLTTSARRSIERERRPTAAVTQDAGP